MKRQGREIFHHLLHPSSRNPSRYQVDFVQDEHNVLVGLLLPQLPLQLLAASPHGVPSIQNEDDDIGGVHDFVELSPNPLRCAFVENLLHPVRCGHGAGAAALGFLPGFEVDLELPVTLTVVVVVLLVYGLEQALQAVVPQFHTLLLPSFAKRLLERLNGQQVHPRRLPFGVFEQRHRQLGAFQNDGKRVLDALRNRFPEGLHFVLRDDPGVAEPTPVGLDAHWASSLLAHFLPVGLLRVHVQALDGAF
mmetsp:Transcript_31309/g.91296  ORF Transcript_31309/g.91296 Transcript_31309/m.91296 type:complete len:249 (-) Transcript_31309:242-988(-)